MLLLTKEELKAYRSTKVCYIYRNKALKSLLMIKNIEKSEIIFITHVNIEEQHIVFITYNSMCLIKSA